MIPWIWSEVYEVDIGPHVYPTRKYRGIRDVLLREGILREEELHAPGPAPTEDLLRVHDPGYLDRIAAGHLTPREQALLEVPFSPALRDAFIVCCGGTTLTGRLALDRGIAVHLGGGFHHAFPARGEGFCLLNDVAVAIRALQAGRPGLRATVIDLDVHHGNGTAAIFAGDPGVFTFSMHQEWNYPVEKPPGDLDIGLEDGTGDQRYLALLEDALHRAVDGHGPDLVFYLAGADPYREDQLGGLALSMEGLRARDREVLARCRRSGVPVAVTLAGGYARRLGDTVEIHCNTVREARAQAGGDAGGG